MTRTTSTGLAIRLGFLLVAGGFSGGAWAQLAPIRTRAADGAPPAAVAGYYEYATLPEAAFAPPPLVRIPGGSFAMGNSYSNLFPGEGWSSEMPVHDVPVGEFFIGRFEFTNEEMARTLQWALTNGLVEVDQTLAVFTNGAGEVTNVVTNLYGTVRNVEGTPQELVNLDETYCQIAFTNGAFAVAAGKTNFPALFATWHGALAICNYLSDREGLARAVDFAPTNWSVDVSAPGYRLPTEAEWEKACRGEDPGTHFPWPDDSVQGTNLYLYSIDPMKANYWDGRYGALSNHPGHPWFGEPLRTTPVGYYNGSQVVTNWSTNVNWRGADFGATNDMANGYGLYDMGGNVYEWCWDYLGTNWYTNALATLPDPTGPGVADSYYSQRVFRGGGFTWYSILTGADPSVLRCSIRAGSEATRGVSYIGFRVARRKLVVNAVAHAADEVSLSYWGESGKVYSVEGTTNLAATNAWPVLAEATNDFTGESQIPVDAGPAFRALRIRATWAP